jgi:hypothetical protein
MRKGRFVKQSLVSLAAVSVVGILVCSQTASAGLQSGNSAYCGHYEDDTSSYDYCQGTMADFRSSSDPNAYAGFNTTSFSKYFYARYNNTNYFCAPNSTNAPLWPSTVNFQGYFYIQMIASSCTEVEFLHASNYSGE